MKLSLLAIALAFVLELQGVSANYRGAGSVRARDLQTVTTGDDDDDDDDSDSRRSMGMSKSSSSTKGSGSKDKGDDDDDDDDDDDEKCFGTVVVGNQNDGTLSILDANDGDLIRTLRIPYNPNTMSQPVPVDVATVNGIIYVSDSANDRVVAFDGVSYDVIDIIQTGDGAAELTVDARGKTLWVSNTADNTVLAVDLDFNVPIRSIEAFDPDAAVDFGDNIINDVLLAPSGEYGFATYTGDGGLIVRFDSSGVIEAYNTDIGEMARLASSFRFNCLYVPTTADNVLDVLFNLDLAVDNSADIPAPFDAESSRDGQYIYITSTANNAIHTFDVGNNELLATVVTTPINSPTKLTHTGDRIFVSHGASDQVSIYSVSAASPIPVFVETVSVGDNPFGINYCEPTALCAS